MSKIAEMLARAGAPVAGWTPKRPEPPTYVEIRERVGREAKRRGDYAGVPIPNEIAKLRVCKRYQYASLDGKGGTRGVYEREPQQDGCEFVNSWIRRCSFVQIVIGREAGKSFHIKVVNGPAQRAAVALDCIGLSGTFDVAAELRAQEKLKTLIKPHLFDAYRICGSFLETSRRSGLVYLFRRLAPTVAFSCRPGEGGDDQGARFVAALCLHPIGYYDQTPFGVMVPTDDVIAHLLTMRGDEHYFWRKSNQHGVLAHAASL